MNDLVRIRRHTCKIGSPPGTFELDHWTEVLYIGDFQSGRIYWQASQNADCNDISRAVLRLVKAENMYSLVATAQVAISSRPHHSAMNSAIVVVTRWILLILTLSSNPWRLSPMGP